MLNHVEMYKSFFIVKAVPPGEILAVMQDSDEPQDVIDEMMAFFKAQGISENELAFEEIEA